MVRAVLSARRCLRHGIALVPDDPDQSMRLGPGDTVDGIVQLYESACGRSRDAIDRCRSLDHLAAVPSFGKGR